MIRTVEMDFEYSNSIDGPPRPPHELYSQACSSDQITIISWRDIWLTNIKANHANYGPFNDKGIGQLYGKFARQPVIVAGSGPSLKGNIEQLQDTKGIPVLSCLHNFHMMIDRGIPVEAFVSLDAGEVTIEEISEGGQHDHDFYVEETRNHTLLAFIGTSPRLLALWKGKILFYNCPLPDAKLAKEVEEIEDFGTHVSSGGNVLGACVYIAKAIMGANPIVFVGADFSFSYTKKFHAWDSKYDKNLGIALRAHDVWGNKVLTWQSYYNFKNFFDWVACTIPGIYINCTEGGILGAYPDGNIKQIHQMPLEQCLRMYSQYEEMRNQCIDPACGEKKILY